MNKSILALGAIIALTAILVIPSIYTPIHVWARIHKHPHPSGPPTTCSAFISRASDHFVFSVSHLRSGSCAASGATSQDTAEIGPLGGGSVGGKSSCSASSASQSSAHVTSGTGPGVVSCSTSHSP